MPRTPMPWNRLAAEFVVIVVGVLVALGVEAWRSEQGERRAEQELLTRLDQEFATNAERLPETQKSQLEMLQAAEALFELTGPTSPDVPSDSVALLILASMSRSTFTAVSGVLNSVISSGQLQIIRDDSLRAGLAAWPDLVSRLNASEVATWTDVDQHFIPYLSERIAWRSVDHIGGNEAYPIPSRFEPGWMDVLKERLFENLLGNHHTYTQVILSQSEELAVRLEVIRSLIARNLTP